MLAAAVAAALLGQSSTAPDTAGSDPIVFVVGVLLVTAIVAVVVARRSKR